MKNTIAESIRKMVLRGRKPVTPETLTPPPPMPEARAAETLSRFAEILDRLEASRRAMDRAHDSVIEAGKLDLAELVATGQPLPKLGTLRAGAEDSSVEVAATKAAADAMAADAGAAISRLRDVAAERLDLLELALRTETTLPAWLDRSTAESAIRSMPQWQEIANFRHRLTVAHRPRIPVVLAGPAKVRLPDWRVAPMAPSDKARGPLGSRDSWSPAGIADQCRAFLSTVAEIKTKATSKPEQEAAGAAL